MVLLFKAPLGLLAQDTSHGAPVEDGVQAITIAEKALVKIYGKEKIESERPFTAVTQSFGCRLERR